MSTSQPPATPPRPLSGSKLAAWRALMTAHARVLPLLDAELQREADLDLRSYDALLHTYEAGAEGIRMVDLAQEVLLSKSGLTTLVDRLEERGLLRRVPDPSDRRATRLTITEAGIAAFRSAAAVHKVGIARYFADHITAAEAKTIADVLDRVQRHALGS